MRADCGTTESSVKLSHFTATNWKHDQMKVGTDSEKPSKGFAVMENSAGFSERFSDKTTAAGVT